MRNLIYLEGYYKYSYIFGSNSVCLCLGRVAYCIRIYLKLICREPPPHGGGSSMNNGFKHFLLSSRRWALGLDRKYPLIGKHSHPTYDTCFVCAAVGGHTKAVTCQHFLPLTCNAEAALVRKITQMLVLCFYSCWSGIQTRDREPAIAHIPAVVPKEYWGYSHLWTDHHCTRPAPTCGKTKENV